MELSRADVPFPSLCAVRYCVVLFGVCLVDLYGRECTGGSKPFPEIRGTGMCIRIGTVKFSKVPIRYGAIVI